MGQAYIYEIKVLRKWDAQQKCYRFFVGCSDFHDKVHSANEEQRPVVESLLVAQDPRKIKVIVEDLSSKNNKGCKSCGPFYIQSKVGILAGLGDYCRQKGIACENVEYRYCRVASMGPIINNLSVSPHMFPSTRSLEVGCIVDEIENTIKDLRLHVSHPALKQVYADEVKKIRIIFEKLRLTQHRSASIADYIHASSTKDNRVDVLKHLLTFDSGLLDIKMTYEILHAKEHDRVIAFAGGTHINRVSELLKKIGYEEVDSTKLSYKKMPDVSKCLGSNIVDGAFCVKPAPLPVKTIQKYLTK